jgi:FkbM family methyltransferase
VLHAPEHEPKNAFLQAEGPHPGATAFPVRTGRLATMLADWPRVDFIKADVEGGEEGFIEGAWPLLERDRPDLVLEFNALRCKDPAALLAGLEGLYKQTGSSGRTAG